MSYSETDLLNIKYNGKKAFKYVHLTADEKKSVKQWLINYSNQFLQKEYQLKLKIPIVFSPRMKSTLAEVLYYSADRNSKKIIKEKMVFSELFIAASRFDPNLKLRKQIILNTLKHELVHYALFILGKNYKDGETDFEKELCRLKISSSGRTARCHNDFNHVKSCYYCIYDEYNLPNGKVRLTHTKIPIYINRDRFVVTRTLDAFNTESLQNA